METPRNFITAVINLRDVSTNKRYYMFYRHAILQRTYISPLLIKHNSSDQIETSLNSSAGKCPA